MTKRLTGMIAALALVMMSYDPAQAVFKGVLQQNVPWTLKVTPAQPNGGSTAVTVTFVNARGRPDIDIFLVAPGEAAIIYDEAKIPRGIRRIIIQVDNPTGGGVVVKVVQGLNEFEDPYEGDVSQVYNVD